MIITACTEDYVPYLKVLLASLEANSPQDLVTIYPVNFEVRGLQERFSQYQWKPRRVGFGKNKEGIMCCYRTLLFKEHFEKGTEPVLWLDTDVIVRKSLDHFWRDLRPNSLKVKVNRGDIRIRTRFQTGVFALGHSEQTKRFVDNYNKVCQKHPVWYQDQIQLYKVYERHRLDIDLIAMSDSYNDKRHPKRKGSTIWHYKNTYPKTHAKFDGRVVDEYSKYLKLAENRIV